MSVRAAQRILLGLVVVSALVGGVLSSPPSQAAQSAIIPGCTGVTLAANDDESSERITLPFTVKFGNRSFSGLWVNNNGNVTFDEPLRDYTPFGLERTERQIIAPFFADVDTRAAGSRVVTAGPARYAGRPAYCVNWLGVGYYDSHDDLTNSFQLVLVDRSDVSPGAFDIVFNYGRLLWETGDASDGDQGRGGVSAAVGFSNGDEQYFQMPGSLRPGSFVDDGTDPLAANTNAGVPGRFRWQMRGGAAPTEYVAMGDSFQSGEGAYSYIPGTDKRANRCHRSAKAYPRRLTDSGSVDQELTFVACSGAKINEISHPYAAPDKQGEHAQLDALGPDTGLVTLGIAGNDLKFSETIRDCVLGNAGALLGRLPWLLASCENLRGLAARRLLRSLRSGDIGARLADAYRQIRLRAWRARVVVVTYPQFYRPPNFVEGMGWCAGVRGSDQRWINARIREANQVIADLARSYGFDVADMTNVFAASGHGLCSGNAAMNGLIRDGDDNKYPGRGSYHPNALGHELMADRVAATLSSATATAPRQQAHGAVQGSGEATHETILVASRATVRRSVSVDGPELAINTAWQDGRVRLRLRSPSGVVYSGAEPRGADHLAGPTFERFAVPAPERGTWKIELHGDEVFGAATSVDLRTYVRPERNRPPTAVGTTVIEPSGVVVLDASSSHDPEGSRLTYRWDFGDGQGATGRSVRHRYAPGRFVPTLVVRDARGAEGFETLHVVVKKPRGRARARLTFFNDRGHRAKPVAVKGLRVKTRNNGRALVRWRPLRRVHSYRVGLISRKAGHKRAGHWRSVRKPRLVLRGLKPGRRYWVMVLPGVATGSATGVTFRVKGRH